MEVYFSSTSSDNRPFRAIGGGFFVPKVRGGQGRAVTFCGRSPRSALLSHRILITGRKRVYYAIVAGARLVFGRIEARGVDASLF